MDARGLNQRNDGAAMRILQSIRHFWLGTLHYLFGRAPAAREPKPKPPRARVLEKLLLMSFRDHGVEASVEDGDVVFPGRKDRVWARVAREWVPDGPGAQLDLRWELPDGRTLVESFGGFGDSPERALADAAEGFLHGSFHVMLRGLLDHECSHVQLLEMKIGGRMRKVVHGLVISRGGDEGSPPPTDWFPDFHEALDKTELSGGLHWIRLYVAQAKGEVLAVETLLDNEPWPALHEALAGVAWPKADHFQSVRTFLIVKDL